MINNSSKRDLDCTLFLGQFESRQPLPLFSGYEGGLLGLNGQKIGTGRTIAQGSRATYAPRREKCVVGWDFLFRKPEMAL